MLRLTGPMPVLPVPVLVPVRLVHPLRAWLCSVMCIDKSKMIATAEADYRERKEESIVEAVIIDRKGLGAPAVAIEMDR